MSRIPLVPVERQSAAIREFMDRRGELNVFRLLANAPTVFVGWSQMVDEILDSSTFTPRIRELVILRVAYLQCARYELGQHRDLARAAGLTPIQISAVSGFGSVDEAGFSNAEIAVLLTVTELCTTRRLSANTYAAAHEVLRDEALTEMLMIVSCYYGLALVLNAADLELDHTARIQV